MRQPASNDFDVVVIGGGPAGCATALSLRAHAPSLSVALVEASGYGQPRLGESLPPPATQLLKHLRVWDAFRHAGHREVHGTASVWGQRQVQEDDFIFSARGSGWHLDRTRFDALLADEAAHAGTTLLVEKRLRSVARTASGGWRLGLSDGQELRASFVVDASGRKGAVTRRIGARPAALDRLTGFGRFFVETEKHDPRTLVEAFDDGWWYTAGLPGGKRVVVCMTDVDIARRLRLRQLHSWQATLGATRRVQAIVRSATPTGPLLARPCESRLLHAVAGVSWLAVGDAASVFDPLSSQGIVKALRCGVFASYAIADWLNDGDRSGLHNYGRYVHSEFAAYLKARDTYYGFEARWPHSEFWRRRQPRRDGSTPVSGPDPEKTLLPAVDLHKAAPGPT